MKNSTDVKLISNIFKSIKDEDPTWTVDVAEWVNNQMGGSAKGWAWESSFFDVGIDNCLSISRADAVSPMSDLSFDFPGKSINIQAKAYTMKNGKGSVQCSTMAKTGFFEKSKKYLTEAYDGKEYADFLRTFNVPIDLILTSDVVTQKAKYYCIDFIDYIKHTTRCEWVISRKTKKKTHAKLYMFDNRGDEKVAFTIGSEKSSNKNCFSRGIWMYNWVLEQECPKPLDTVTFEQGQSLFRAWRNNKN